MLAMAASGLVFALAGGGARSTFVAVRK